MCREEYCFHGRTVCRGEEPAIIGLPTSEQPKVYPTIRHIVRTGR
jgi:hypothetical protein